MSLINGLREFDGFSLNPSTRQLTRHGQALPLAPKTFDLLLLLVESGGRALSKTELMQALWPDTFVEEANLSFQISTLRKALGEDGAKWIETIPKHGYRFTATVEASDAVPPVEPPPAEPPLPKRRASQLWLLAAAGAAAALILFLWFAKPVPKEGRPVSHAVPLTAWPGLQQNPSLSPDGNQVTFSWDGARADNYDIYVKSVDAGEPIRITTDPAADDQPVWSPDGRSIAFLRFRSENRADVFVIPALGGAERKVTSFVFQGRGGKLGIVGGSGSLAWTPDGKWLAFGGVPAENENEAPGIWLAALDGAERRRLTSVPPPYFGDWAPAFSRDGKYVAFHRDRSLGISAAFVLPLHQLSPAGAPERLSPDGPGVIIALAWNPDSTGILMSLTGHLGLSRMYEIPFRPGRPVDPKDTTLLPFGERARGISVATNGRIVYGARHRDANLWHVDLTASQDRPHVRVAASVLDEATPDYSPDGTRLAFASTRSGVQEIWLSGADGASPKQMTSMGGPQCANPIWSPDGRLILFNSRKEGSADLYLLDPATGELRRITDDATEEYQARWSRDGRTIYFGSNRTGRSEIWRMPAAGGAPVQITQQGGSTAAESPDGKYLYYGKDEQVPTSIWRVPVNGGKEEPLIKGVSYALNFVVAQRGIYYLAMGDRRDQTSLDFFDYATGKRSTLAAVNKTLWWGMALSRDEKSLLYSVVDSAGSNLMVVNPVRQPVQ